MFPGMTVEENLWMGGYLMEKSTQAREAAERVFEKYPRLAERRNKPAGVLSGGERRLLEISRALVMEPEVLLVDEPSIGLEPRFIDMVFEILDDLQNNEGKTIIMVEAERQEGPGVRRHRLCPGLRPDRHRRPGARNSCRTRTSGGCSWGGSGPSGTPGWSLLAIRKIESPGIGASTPTPSLPHQGGGG